MLDSFKSEQRKAVGDTKFVFSTTPAMRTYTFTTSATSLCVPKLMSEAATFEDRLLQPHQGAHSAVLVHAVRSRLGQFNDVVSQFLGHESH